jgi:uncharacterized peroxidase-related enzyme
MANFSYSRDFMGVADVFLRSPQYYRPLLDFIENVMVGESGLSAAEREIIAAHVSHINGCHFCVNAHIATLNAMGVDSETTSALREGQDITGVRDELKYLLTFAEKLTRTPDAMSQVDIDTLKDQGVPEQMIEDAVNVVSLFGYMNRLVDAFGVKGAPDYFKIVGTSLAKNGYAKLLPRQAA